MRAMRARSAAMAASSSLMRASRGSFFGLAQQLVELFFQLAHFAARAGADGDAPADGAAHRAHHVQVVGRAVAAVAGALALPFRRFGELRAHQVGQRQVLEEDLHELFLAQAEDEVVLAFAGIAGLALAAARTAAALGPLDAVAADEVLVARMHHLADAALAVAEDRLAQVLLRDVHLLAALDVADAAPVDGALHRLAHLLLVAAQEALAVADRLVLAGRASVDDALSAIRSEAPAANGRVAGGAVGASAAGVAISCSCARAGTTRTAAAPACWCSPWRPCG